jgi:Protein of unknown function (DUF3558)
MEKPMTRFVRRNNAVLLAALVLSGCGGATAPTPTGPTAAPATATAVPPTKAPTEPPMATQVVIDPCSLLTQQEADALAGTPLETGAPQGPAGAAPYSCLWTFDPTGPTGQVEVYLGENAKKILDIDRDTLGHEFVAVPGIGDEAWAETNAIFVRKGTTWIAILLVRLNDPSENEQPLIEAARRLAERF